MLLASVNAADRLAALQAGRMCISTAKPQGRYGVAWPVFWRQASHCMKPKTHPVYSQQQRDVPASFRRQGCARRQLESDHPARIEDERRKSKTTTTKKKQSSARDFFLLAVFARCLPFVVSLLQAKAEEAHGVVLKTCNLSAPGSLGDLHRVALQRSVFLAGMVPGRFVGAPLAAAAGYLWGR